MKSNILASLVLFVLIALQQSLVAQPSASNQKYSGEYIIELTESQFKGNNSVKVRIYYKGNKANPFEHTFGELYIARKGVRTSQNMKHLGRLSADTRSIDVAIQWNDLKPSGRNYNAFLRYTSNHKEIPKELQITNHIVLP
jgi:hypothetical protein